jgi:hypothetical protein
MKLTLLALCVLAPGLVLGQSLAEVAKKEKTRREQNKREGKQSQVISETDLESVSGGPATSSDVSVGEASSSGSSSSASRSSSEEYVEGESEEDANIPAFIPPDAPLPEKLELFERMRQQYQRQVQEIDEAIAKNDTRLKQLESEIASASALGGAGLPVAPQTGTGAATRPMTGQESATLAGEQTRLQEANAQLRARKEELKTNLQAKGRAAGIPAGYLRF